MRGDKKIASWTRFQPPSMHPSRQAALSKP